MRQSGNCIIGDPIKVDNYTANWVNVKLSPFVYYRKQDEICNLLDKCVGPHTELDYGDYVSIRFLEKCDLELFCKETAS